MWTSSLNHLVICCVLWVSLRHYWVAEILQIETSTCFWWCVQQYIPAIGRIWLFHKTIVCILFLGQSHCMKFQPSIALTRTKWISFRKVALLSVLSASSSHFFPHRISHLRALHTAWLSPPAWRLVCYSPFLWPPWLQTQIKTGSLVEQVQ